MFYGLYRGCYTKRPGPALGPFATREEASSRLTSLLRGLEGLERLGIAKRKEGQANG